MAHDVATDTPTPSSPSTRRSRALRPVLYALGLVVLWLAIGGFGGGYVGRLGEVQENDNAAFLPATADSTRVGELQADFVDSAVLPAFLVYENTAGITEADRETVAEDVTEIARLTGVPAEALVPEESADGQALRVFVPLEAPDQGSVEATERFTELVVEMREVVEDGDGITGQVAGPAASVVDFSEAFGEIDGLLLLVTAVIVTVILLLVYRSPILPIVVLIAAVLALGSASTVIFALASNDVVTLNGQSQGILFILVFGVFTDYALLLIARFREELRRHESRFTAVGVALRRSAEPIAASAGTVILGLLCLLVSDSNATRGLAVSGIGIAAALVVALTFLPAALALLGRAAFWPFRPRYGSRPAEERGVWARVAALVGGRPRAAWVVSVLVLVIGAAFLPQLRASGIPQSEVFLVEVPSVVGQDTLGRHFPAGAVDPTIVLAAADSLDEVVEVVTGVDGVSSVEPTLDTPPGPPVPGPPVPGAPEPAPRVVDGRVQLEVILDDAADSDEAVQTVRRLRTALDPIEGADALVGGTSAVQLDTNTTAERDNRVIIPLILLVIFLVLTLLLRAIVAPLLLMATVVLSFAATLGVSALVFNYVFDYPGGDVGTPLLGFVFLVALGIDYNIFLMTRVREEAARHGTREGTLIALRVTGGVITSAGVVLAATFAALGVLPLIFLAQIAFIVAFGVLLDTLLVRSILVPALTIEVGRWVWWPGALSRRPAAGSPAVRPSTGAAAPSR